MTAVDNERILSQIGHTLSGDTSWTDRSAGRVDTLREYLEEFGQPDPELDGIPVLEIKVDDNERIKYAHGQDAPKFFQIIPEGEKHAGPSVEFIDQDKNPVTPNLCVKIEISTDEEHQFNYIISGNDVLEVATRRPTTEEKPAEKAASHIIYDTVPLSRAKFYEGWTKTAPIEVKRLEEDDRDKFMLFLEQGASNVAVRAEARRSTQERASIPAPRPNRS